MLPHWLLKALSQRDVRRIILGLSLEDRESIRATPESELIRFHFGFGMYLRNGFRRGRFPFLLGQCRWVVEQSAQPMSFDALSSAAMTEIWRVLQSDGPRSGSGRTT